MKVSIIILSWNTKQLLKQCLGSVTSDQQTATSKKPVTDHRSPITEVIVVDNGSTDGSPEMVRRYFPWVRLIRNKQNLGFARGNNQGIKAATGDLIMLLNSDTIVQKGAVEKLAVHLIKSLEIAAVSPLLLNEDGSTQRDPCYLKLPSPITVLFYYNSLLKKIAIKFFPWLLFSATDSSQPAAVDQLPGAAIMLKKEILKKLKGLDEAYLLYFEDVDLSFRIQKLGYGLEVVPEAKIVHFGRKSIKPLVQREGIEKFYFLNFSSLFLFCDKHYSELKTLLIKIIVFGHLFLTLKFGLIRKLLAR